MGLVYQPRKPQALVTAQETGRANRNAGRGPFIRLPPSCVLPAGSGQQLIIPAPHRLVNSRPPCPGPGRPWGKAGQSTSR